MIGPLYHGSAGADLSSLKYRFVRADSSDSYKLTQLTDPHTYDRVFALANAPADDGDCELVENGEAKLDFGGTVTPWGPVTSDSVGKAVAWSYGERLLGHYVPRETKDANTWRSAGSGERWTVRLAGNEGAGLRGTVVALYKFGTDGGAISTITMRGPQGGSVAIPSGATILPSSFYRVVTTFTSATDAGTIALAIGGLTLVAATAISAGGNVWDDGNTVSVVNDVTSSTAAATLTIATEAATAGELQLVLDWAVVPAA